MVLELADAVSFARACEEAILGAHQERPAQRVAYATLVSTRRLAEAIARLTPTWAYEARILLRAMLEQYFNLSWILLRDSHRRANRFLQHLAVERHEIAESIPPEDRRPGFERSLAEIRQHREETRHLFRVRPKEKPVSPATPTPRKSGAKWQKNWSGRNFRERVEEVHADASPSNLGIRTFSYSLYRWFSAATHGSAVHLAPLLRATKYGLRPAAQPDPTPWAHSQAAAVLLLGVLVHLHSVANFSAEMEEDLERLIARMAPQGAGESP